MTPDQARDEMLAVFKTAWDSTGFQAVYSDVGGEPPSEEVPWARVVVRHADGGQSAFGVAAKRYTHQGTLWVQVFSPMGDGATKAYDLAYLVLLAYSQARGASVWYRRPRILDVVNAKGAFEQKNVLIDFSYDDVR